MVGYEYLNLLFKAILTKSKAIQGRFHVSGKNGTEINIGNLGELVEEVLLKEKESGPFGLMLPPISVGDYRTGGKWEDVNIRMFFLKTTYYNSENQVASRNRSTGTSTHTVLQDWHDMKRCALGFLMALSKIQKTKNLINTTFRLVGQHKITPVSEIGNKRLSGVFVEFNCQTFNQCEIEDYVENEIDSIVVPSADSHPEHNL